VITFDEIVALHTCTFEQFENTDKEVVRLFIGWRINSGAEAKERPMSAVSITNNQRTSNIRKN